MKIIAGLTAFTDFVQKNLHTQLQSLIPSITDIEAQHIYMFHNTDVTCYKDRANQLLNDGVVMSLPVATEQQIHLVVTPRIGTISPWSSKAGDIFKNCGLFSDTVTERVEKAVLITLSFSQKTNFTNNMLPVAVEQLLYDRMTQSIFYSINDAKALFHKQEPQPLNTFDVMSNGKSALEQANINFGFALSADEIEYLTNAYVNDIKRNPTDTELMMFAQANSEHCRHKIFNSEWHIDGEQQSYSLFDMIKNTYKNSPENVLSAYKDNSSVISGHEIDRFYPQVNTNNQSVYGFNTEQTDILMKVETHNHPTGIAPFAGAATGSGGEIRDEGATGRGSKPKAGLTAFNVSHLHIPNMPEPWEQDTKDYGTPSRMATSLEIMTQAPLGGAAFNNEFGRPALNGYFRSFQLNTHSDINAMRGYHKPIMLAGGYGNISHKHVQKNQIEAGDLLIVLGGPSMLIGLGGGAASSVDSGAQSEDLDFASVQRDNPEMERRCQEVIDTCWAYGDYNPIISVHDVGAGGISNAMPELVNDANRGAVLELRKVPSLEHGMSPMEIWSNEAQERYVLAISPSSLEKFSAICARERCPFAVLGEATDIRHLTVNDTHFANKPVDMPMQVLLGGTPRMSRSFECVEYKGHVFDTSNIDIKDACLRVLRQPTVASKSFLISIGDRSITGMVARDQYVGRYQVPVADCAVTTTGLDTHKGEAMSLGERPPVALLNPAASARLAVGEAITNIASARISTLNDVKMSANWMAAAGQTGEDQALYDAVYTIGMELCPKLGIAIPVGKDSLSMHTKWKDTANDVHGAEKSVTSPMTVVITAFAPVIDVTQTLTPELKTLSQIGESHLIHIDLGRGKNRLAGSILAQVYNEIGGATASDTPDLDNADDLINFFNFIQEANEKQLLSAYHDIGDGGLFATLSEMQFTSRLGVSVDLKAPDLLAQLFAEELGAVVQVSVDNLVAIQALADTYKLTDMIHVIGRVSDEFDGVQINQSQNNEIIFDRVTLQEAWASVSHQIQRLRDNPDCADEEFALIADDTHKGLIAKASYDLDTAIEAPYINKSTPKIAVLREQGVNGQLEMAASFVKVGFEAVDVHMSDLMAGHVNLDQFNGLVACGGFSYGDVLGAGGGWAKSILFNEGLREQFGAFFERDSTFTLGVCNGCQMLSQLKELIPGGANLPRFRQNTSARFEARTVNVRVDRSKSVLLDGMGGSILPIVVAHGEGRLDASADELKALAMRAQIGMRYVDSNGKITQHYPLNPNGSPNGITGLCSEDGRVTMMMPHPERNIRALNHSWKPDEWQQDGAWLRMFRNARVFVG